MADTGITQRFRAAVDRFSGREQGPAGLPNRLCKACVQVLPVAGAGLSLFSAPTMRIPIGSSDPAAETAERLQFTVAQGPCFQAHHTGQSVVAPAAVIAAQWPLFHDGLISQTPITGIVSMPLSDGLAGIGVLDLYIHQPHDIGLVDLGDVHTIAADIATRLDDEAMFPSFRDGPPWETPLWLENPGAAARGYVLLAMGMISVALDLKLDDSLAALRGHAYAAGRTVDGVAGDVVNRSLPATHLAPDMNY